MKRFTELRQIEPHPSDCTQHLLKPCLAFISIECTQLQGKLIKKFKKQKCLLKFSGLILGSFYLLLGNFSFKRFQCKKSVKKVRGLIKNLKRICWMIYKIFSKIPDLLIFTNKYLKNPDIYQKWSMTKTIEHTHRNHVVRYGARRHGKRGHLELIKRLTKWFCVLYFNVGNV